MTTRQISFLFLLIIVPLFSIANDNYFATSDLKVRSGAGREYSVSFTLQKGDEVEVLSKNGDWFKIKYLEKTGFAYSKYLKPISDVNTSQQLDSGKSAAPILIFLGLIVFIWLLPILIIGGSSKTTSGEKVAWILAVLFISWFAWIFYMLLAPIKKNE